MEVRELLTEYGFDGETTPIIIGSALNALEVSISTISSSSWQQIKLLNFGKFVHLGMISLQIGYVVHCTRLKIIMANHTGSERVELLSDTLVGNL